MGKKQMVMLLAMGSLVFGFFGMTHIACLVIFLYQLTAIEVSLPSNHDVCSCKEQYIENAEMKEWLKNKNK